MNIKCVRTIIVALAVPSILAGCAESSVAGPERADHLMVAAEDGVLFLTQDATDGAAMEALFSGGVTVDASGCMRLETEGDYGVTAVWPAGYTLDRTDGIRVFDSSGTPVGRVGETFVLAGGEVPELPDALGFNERDRKLAADRCPGRYWLVNGG